VVPVTYAIEAEGLVKRFGATTALAGVDLAAPTGRVLGLLGPNGAGKTTAVRVLATLIRPDSGVARVSGFDVVRQAHEVRQLVALTGQYAALDEGLTGVQNLLLVGRLLGLSRRDAKARAAALLTRFGLSDAGGRRAKTYSGGMRRRLDLAVSLVGRPSVLYLDEPTTGLDPHSRNELWSIVRGLVADGATVLLTTQYMDEADQLADDIVVVDRGTVIATGTPDELKTRTGGQTLEIRPADPARIEEAAGIVAALTGVRPVAEGGRLSAPVSDPALPAAVLRRLDDAAITVTELALRLPSLDDVFLSLTGHRAEEQGEPVAETVAGRA
jgi:oleandomycin transport system ATP-binding protein